jgi:DNA polymerase-3 subunit delta'
VGVRWTKPLMPFADVVGHRRIVSLLSKALNRETLPPALLFAGPAGVGKRRVALAVAQVVNCLKPRSTPDLERDACGACPACTRIARGVHPDVLVVEPGDLGSIKIEQVRDVIGRAAYRPFEGRRRVVIIDDAEALTPEAQNALLKSLEEPPSATVFILVSAMPDSLLPTVLSRCPRLRFVPLDAADVAAVLIHDHEYTEADARAVAADAEGSVGRALSAESADLAEARATAERLLRQAARATDPARRIDAAQGIPWRKGQPGADRDQLAASLRVMASMLRDVGVLTWKGDRRLLANADLEPVLDELGRSYDSIRTARAYAAVDEALAALERNANPKIVADWLVLRL